MRSNKQRLGLAVVIASLIVVWSAPRVSAQRPAPVTVIRLYTGSDGQSHAEQIEVKLLPSEVPDGSSQLSIGATKITFFRCPPGWVNEWHNVGGLGGRQYVMTLSGRGEVELPDGTKIQLTPGKILLGEDLTGRGHITRTVGAEDWISVHIHLTSQ